ncbi:MAG TPA: hypothetical protein VIG64_01255 [Actinomycetota bacterium]
MGPARPTPAPAQEQPDRAAIQDLLDRRAEAIESRDRAAFMATVGDLSPGFRDEQARLFRSMKDVPFASYELEADWTEWGDIMRAGDRARYPGAEVVTIPLTEERYRIRGLDRSPAVEDLFYTFVKQGGEWLIGQDRDVADLGFDTAQHLWDFGPVRVERHGRFLVFRHPCRKGPCSNLPDYALSMLEAGRARAELYWPGPWPKRVGVVLPTTKSELRHVLQANFDLTTFIAFTYSTVKDGRYSAPRIVLNWRTLEGRSASSLQNVFAHELVHVATRSSAGPHVPVFVDEGFAEHAANEASPASLSFFDYQRSIGGVNGALPEDYQFVSGSGTSIFLNYQTAQSAVDFFVRTWGPRAFERFYKRLGRARGVPGTSEYLTSKALRHTIGVSLDRFEQLWADSLGA